MARMLYVPTLAAGVLALCCQEASGGRANKATGSIAASQTSGEGSTRRPSIPVSSAVLKAIPSPSANTSGPDQKSTLGFALEGLTEACGTEPVPAEALKHAQAAQRAGRGRSTVTPSMMASLKSAVEAEPRLQGAAILLSMAYALGQQDYARAVTVLERTRKRCGDTPSLLLNLGNAHQSAGDLEKAGTAFQQAIDIEQRSAEPDTDMLAALYYNLGNGRQKAKKLPEAIAAYSKAIELKPDKLEAYRGLSLARYKYGDIQEALRIAKVLLKAAPHHKHGRWAAKFVAKVGKPPQSEP